MSVTATILEGWQLSDKDSRLRTAKRRVIEADKIKGWLEQTDESSLQIKRHFIGLLTESSSVGTEDASISCHVGNGYYKNFNVSTSNKYLCTRDRVAIEDYVIGEGWEYQTWEVVAKWEIVEESYYEEALPATGTAYDPAAPVP